MELLDAVVPCNPKSTRFEIDRVETTITSEEFAATYYLPQVPVIVTGIARHWLATQRWSPEYLLGKLKNMAVERAYHFDIGEDHQLARDCEVPSFIADIRSRQSVITRAQSMRVWISQKATYTRWHYDGNGLQVVNVQVRGRKRFSLISPHTPLTCYGFGQGARAGYTDLSDIGTPIRFAVCEIASGDMIFIPQHWYHSVVSLDDENLNINWVWTDTELLMKSRSPTAIREREYIAILYLLGKWLRRLGHSPSWLEYSETYGGVMNLELTRELHKSVSKVAIIKRCLLELSRTLTDNRYRKMNQKRELELNQGVRRNAYDFFQKAG